MSNTIDLQRVCSNIRIIKSAAEELKKMGSDFPTLNRNAVRILAAVNMLELNICDPVELCPLPPPDQTL